MRDSRVSHCCETKEEWRAVKGITVGRLRPDTMFDYKFVGMSHNTLRGAAGGAVLIAELLYRKGYLA